MLTKINTALSSSIYTGLGIAGAVNGSPQNLNYEISKYMFDHLRLLNWLTQNGISLKTAAKKMTLDNLMLGYLNNRQNFWNGVDDAGFNENYAREFLELFTIGRGEEISTGVYTNYTEADISLAAKVFSGFSTASGRNESDVDTETEIFRGRLYPNLLILMVILLNHRLSF